MSIIKHVTLQKIVALDFRYDTRIHNQAVIMRYEKCICRYINVMYYKQRSLLHVSATYGGHLEGGVL